MEALEISIPNYSLDFGTPFLQQECAPVPETIEIPAILVSNCGIPEAEGVYYWSPIIADGSSRLLNANGTWEFTDTGTNRWQLNPVGDTKHYDTNGALTPDLGTWVAGPSGVLPAPTVQAINVQVVISS